MIKREGRSERWGEGRKPAKERGREMLTSMSVLTVSSCPSFMANVFIASRMGR